jgi:hypothetical protein
VARLRRVGDDEFDVDVGVESDSALQFVILTQGEPQSIGPGVQVGAGKEVTGAPVTIGTLSGVFVPPSFVLTFEQGDGYASRGHTKGAVEHM